MTWRMWYSTLVVFTVIAQGFINVALGCCSLPTAWDLFVLRKALLNPRTSPAGSEVVGPSTDEDVY
jgi:hypothetical protein